MIKERKKTEWQIEQIVDKTYLLVKSFDFGAIGNDLDYPQFCNIFMKWHDGRSKRRECKPKDLSVLLFLLKKRKKTMDGIIEEIENYLDSLNI